MSAVIKLLLMICLSWQELPIEIQQVQSTESERAVWQRIDAEQLVVQAKGQAKSLPITALRSVKLAGLAESVERDGLVVLLHDGTRFQPQQITSKGQDVVIELSQAVKLTLSANYIRSVQFQRLAEKQSPQWRAIQESRITGDTLVVIRSADSLDKIEGQILEITDERVVFEFNKQKIEAPRAKLAGLRFLTPAAKVQRVKAIIGDRLGNVYQAVQLVSDSATSVEVTLACGARLSLPVEQLGSIDFSVGSIKYLAEMIAITNEQARGFATKLHVVGAEQLFAPQLVRLPQTKGPSLKMLGSGTVTYRVPDEYNTVAGIVYLAPEGEQFTPCSVEVRLESDVLWQGKLKHPSERLEFNAPVSADKRLQIYVRAESSYPVGDVVVWQELRMMK